MGDNLYWMITITDRNQSQKFLSFYKTYGIEVVLSTLGKGTAASEILNDFGLEATQKAVLLSVVTGKVWSAVQKGLQTIMLIDIPGTGIAFTMPLSSIGGKRQLEFLTNGQPFQKGEESVLIDTKPGLYRADYGRSAPRKRRRRHRYPREGHRHGGRGKVPRRFPRH